MPRPILPAAAVHPAIADKVGLPDKSTLAEVQAAVAAHDVVIVGMAQNPHPKEAKQALKKAGVAYTYLEYGSYFSRWRDRLALKMWTGWPTFPMVFVRGQLVGGASDLQKIIDAGELPALLSGPRVG